MFVNIGDFIIKINLGKDVADPQVAYSKNKTEIELLIYLRAFLIHTKPKKVDFEIEFVDLKDPELLTVTNNKISYLPLFQNVGEKKVITYFQLGIYQFETVLKNVLLMILKKNGGFGIHASSASVKNNAYLFLAESGGGKSTSVELLKETFPTLSDDITLIRKLGSKYFVFQTPFIEKPWWIKKRSELYPVGKIFFLHKSNEFKAGKTTGEKRRADVLPQVIAAQNPDKKISKNVSDFIKSTNNFYDLYFAKEPVELVKLILHI